MDWYTFPEVRRRHPGEIPRDPFGPLVDKLNMAANRVEERKRVEKMWVCIVCIEEDGSGK